MPPQFSKPDLTLILVLSRLTINDDLTSNRITVRLISLFVPVQVSISAAVVWKTGRASLIVSCFISENDRVKASSLHVVPLKLHKNIQKYNDMSFVSIYDI